MKLCNIKDIDAFFDTVNKCKGGVYLISPYGDKINLKSKIAQYLTAAKLFSHDGMIDELELQLDNKADMNVMIAYCLYRGE